MLFFLLLKRLLIPVYLRMRISHFNVSQTTYGSIWDYSQSFYAICDIGHFLFLGPRAPVKNPCFEMYAGSNSFSERESRALANYLNTTKDNIIAYVSLHTYGQFWLTPYGFTNKPPDRYQELVQYLSKFLSVIDLIHDFAKVKLIINPLNKIIMQN